jgi:hypothetical protein
MLGSELKARLMRKGTACAFFVFAVSFAFYYRR